MILLYSAGIIPMKTKKGKTISISLQIDFFMFVLYFTTEKLI